MIIVIHHDFQWQWTPLAAGQRPLPSDRARIRGDGTIEVHRLVNIPGNQTHINVPDERVPQMGRDLEATIDGEGDLVFPDEATQDGTRDALWRHLVASVHGAGMVPLQHWKDIQVRDDPEMTEHLRSRLPEKE